MYVTEQITSEQFAVCLLAVLNHSKVKASAIMFCNSETLMQNCVMYVMFYESGLQ